MGSTKAKKRKIASILAYVSGIFLLLSGVSGFSTWAKIGSIVLDVVDFFWLRILFLILLIVAWLGGISVIIGGYLFSKKKILTGRILVTVGSGAGVLSFVFNLIVAIWTGEIVLAWFFSSATIGVILSIIAQVLAVKSR